MTTNLLLIDGDEYIFRATAALERETQWDEQNWVLYSNAEECWANLSDMVARLLDRFEPDIYALCFTRGPNFRKEIDETYKAHRSGKRKPLCYSTLRNRAETAYRCIDSPGLEADDVMGILATKPGTNAVIVGQDKDFRSVPGSVWNGEELIEVSEDEADYFHMFQTLTGDQADGYRGCPGMGPKRAEKALMTRPPGQTLWATVIDCYERAGETYADALRCARLARILRWQDWDHENQKPKLWMPYACPMPH